MGACRALFAWPLRPGAFALSAEKRRQRWAGESREGGEEGGKKKNPTGDSGGWAGPAGQGASRAGWWQSWAKFGKAPPGGRGARTRCLHPGGTGRWGGLPLYCQGTGFSLGIMLPHLQAPYQTLGRGKEERWKGAGGTGGAEPVQGDTRGHRGQLALPKAKYAPLPALAFNMIFFFFFCYGSPQTEKIHSSHPL